MGAALAAVFLLLLLVGGQARALQPQYIGPCFRGIGAIILFAAAEGRKTGSRHLVRGRLYVWVWELLIWMQPGLICGVMIAR
jgi:hypothetical protein